MSGKRWWVGLLGYLINPEDFDLKTLVRKVNLADPVSKKP